MQPPKIDAQVHYEFESSLNLEEKKYFEKMVYKAQEKIDKGILKFPDDFIRYGA